VILLMLGLRLGLQQHCGVAGVMHMWGVAALQAEL
jgi:hypothetical protein